MNSGNHEATGMVEGLVPASHAMDPFLRKACEAIGEVIEFWGFKRDMGMVWTWLYLTGEEATAQTVREYFAISTGQTSTVLTSLVEWGVVERKSRPGRAPDVYSAQTDLWSMISRVWRERELRMVEKTRKALDEVLHGIREKGKTLPLADQKSFRDAEKRLANLQKLAQDGERAIRTFLELSQLDFQSVVKFPRRRP